jgi:hypothetical protein
MEELFVATEQGNIPIERSIAEKYNLQKGTRTPFSGNMIVDKNSDATPKRRKKKSIEEPNRSGVTLTTAEVIDLGAGADSYS